MILNTVVTCWMKLDKLHVLVWQSSSRNHGCSIARARMCWCAREVCTTIATIKTYTVTKINLLCTVLLLTAAKCSLWKENQDNATSVSSLCHCNISLNCSLCSSLFKPFYLISSTHFKWDCIQNYQNYEQVFLATRWILIVTWKNWSNLFKLFSYFLKQNPKYIKFWER